MTIIGTTTTAAPAPSKRRAGCLAGGVIGGLAALVFASLMVTIVLAVGIWPGEAKLTAPILCADDQPDAFVVSDTYTVRPGETSTSFTLYCVGERGDFTDAGFMRPMLLLTALHAVIILFLVFVMGGLLAARKRRRATPPTAASVLDISAMQPMASASTEPIASASPVVSNPIDPEEPLKL